MSTRILHSIFSFVLCLAAVFISTPAIGDLTVTMQTTNENPTMRHLTPAERAAMKQFGLSTWYVSSKKTRIDSYMFSVISDGSDKSIMINRADKTYSLFKCDPAQFKAMLSGKGIAGIVPPPSQGPSRIEKVTPVPGHKGKYDMIMSVEGPTSLTITSDTVQRTMSPGASGTGMGKAEKYDWDPATHKWKPEIYKVVDTHETSIFLGHKVRHYIETMPVVLSNHKGTVSTRTDILAAQDLPPAELAECKAVSTEDPALSQIAGFPLETTTTMTGGPFGTTTIKEVVTSISTKQLPGSIFAIPRGYRYTQTNTFPIPTK